ncbi:kinase-like domain-containing protein [Gigaspora rosea]|uniref:Kinase-like domain-containing protein n=1 Tax=Gigaspora rosea TaxID=44941 RepID=A0A397VQ43_9GLOM|nr:kinase-like domain-containing protein [Gigaspora rosea]
MVIEWIPFDRLENIKKIGKGGFSSVFSANWLDGIRKIGGDYGNYKREHELLSIVALKFLSGSEEAPIDFLKNDKILQDQCTDESVQSYIADLGLSRKKDGASECEIYRVMLYIVPEVLLGRKFTQAADIYGFGVIMAEMSTGKRPFDGYAFDIKLALRICKGASRICTWNT